MQSAPATTAHAAILQKAMQQHQAGRLAEARSNYQRLLRAAPRHADALHLLGVLEAQAGQHARAAQLIRRAIEVRPHEAMFHNNLGNVCIEQGRFDEAEACYRRALALEPDRPDVPNNLGVLLSRRGRAEEAQALLERATQQPQPFASSHENLANHFVRNGQMKQAMEVCVAAMITRPRSLAMRRVLGVVYASLGRNAEAADLYRAWLQEDPDNAEAQFRLVACTGQDVPARAPDRYVEQTFDTFADSFDAKLESLSYRAPALINEAVARLTAPAQQLQVIDAGCGTGLCGPLLKPYARHIVGVDLSAGMLAKARARQVYDELVQGELVAFLQSRPHACELLVSADTLCYFGDLEDFAAAAAGALRSGGGLVFTVESLDAQAGEAGFALQGHGRYSHRRSYVEAVLQRCGFASIELLSSVLRTEAGKPVDGWLVSARAGLA
jgi:predicted TPR repeat methyltransferase